MQPKLQNFSIPQGNPAQINFDVNPDDSITLAGAQIFWNVYEAPFAVPDVSKLKIRKTSGVGGGITVANAPLLKFRVALDAVDTDGMEGNYFHEAQVVGASGPTTVTQGIMTVLEGINKNLVP